MINSFLYISMFDEKNYGLVPLVEDAGTDEQRRTAQLNGIADYMMSAYDPDAAQRTKERYGEVPDVTNESDRRYWAGVAFAREHGVPDNPEAYWLSNKQDIPAGLETREQMYEAIGAELDANVRKAWDEQVAEEKRMIALRDQQGKQVMEALDRVALDAGHFREVRAEDLKLLEDAGYSADSIDRAKMALRVLEHGDGLTDYYVASLYLGDDATAKQLLAAMMEANGAYRGERDAQAGLAAGVRDSVLGAAEPWVGVLKQVLPGMNNETSDIQLAHIYFDESKVDKDGGAVVMGHYLNAEELARFKSGGDASIEQARELKGQLADMRETARIEAAKDGSMGYMGARAALLLPEMAVRYANMYGAASDIHNAMQQNYLQGIGANAALRQEFEDKKKQLEQLKGLPLRWRGYGSGVKGEDGKELTNGELMAKLEAEVGGKSYEEISKDAIAGRTIAYGAIQYLAMKAGLGATSKGMGAVLGRFGASGVAGSMAAGAARLNSTWAGAALSRTAVSAYDIGVAMPLVDGTLKALYDVTLMSDKRLAQGTEELAQYLAQLGTMRFYAETGLSALGGAAMGTAGARKNALRLLNNKERWLQHGGLAEDWERLQGTPKSKRADEVVKIWSSYTSTPEAKEATIMRAIKHCKGELDRKEAEETLAREEYQAAMMARGYTLEDAPEDGMVYLYTKGRYDDATGRYERGEERIKLRREDAERYLTMSMRNQFERLSGLMADIGAREVFVKALSDKLGLEVQEILGADSGSRMKERAVAAEKRKKALMDGGMTEEEAGRTIDKAVDEKLTLDAVIQMHKDFTARTKMAEQRGERKGGDGEALSFAHVVRQIVGGIANIPARVARVARIAHNATFRDVVEEYAEQAGHALTERHGISRVELLRDLLKLRDQLRTSADKNTRKAAEMFIGLDDKNDAELIAKINGDKGEALFTGDETRRINQEVTEAMSRILLSRLTDIARNEKGRLPAWMARVLDEADAMEKLNVLDEERQRTLMEMHNDLLLAKAVSDAMERSGESFEAIGKRLGLDMSAVEEVGRENKVTPEDIARAYAKYKTLNMQYEAMLANGGRAFEPTVFYAQASAGQEEADAANAERDKAEQDRVTAQLEELKQEPGNEVKTQAELVRENGERYTQAKADDVAGNVSAVEDGVFVGGKALDIRDENGVVCRGGVVEVDGLQILPQFKLGADKQSGVVHPLRGVYCPDHDPIRIWQREDGSMMVMTGRHRLDACKRAGVSKIVAYVYRETPERNEQWAHRYDVESNIKDNQATPLEVALYVRGEWTDGRALSNEEVERAGIDREGKMGSVGLKIGRNAGESVMDALRNGLIDDKDALELAMTCPGDDFIQGKGLAALRDGVSKYVASERMRCEMAKRELAERAGAGGEMDLFGGFIEDEEFNRFLSTYITQKRRELHDKERYLSTVTGKKNAGKAVRYGVDVRDPEAVKRGLKETRDALARWENPYTDAELMEEMRKAWHRRNGGEAPEEEPDNKTDFSVIGERALTWHRYGDDRRFLGAYDRRERVELDASKFRYKKGKERGKALTLDDVADRTEKALLGAIERVYGEHWLTYRERRTRIQQEVDKRVPNVHTDISAVSDYMMQHAAFDKGDVERFVRDRKPYDVSGVNHEKLWRLPDVLDAQELYDAYPWLADVLVGEEAMGLQVLGYTNGDYIFINERTWFNKRKTLLHEVQHMVQNYEGFARGSSVALSREDFEAAYRDALAEARRNRNRHHSSEDADKRVRAFEEIERRYIGNQSGFKQWLHRVSLGLFGDYVDDFGLYHRSAGEIESRNVQKRANMSAKERERVPFNETLDYAPEEGIVAYAFERRDARRQAGKENDEVRVDFSFGGQRARNYGRYEDAGLTFIDPADGKKKFAIDSRKARLQTKGLTPLLNVRIGGHRDTSLGALLDFPELFEAYPELKNIHVRFYAPKSMNAAECGFTRPAVPGGEAVLIGINSLSVKAYGMGELMDTLLHEAQHVIQGLEGFSMGANTGYDRMRALAYVDKAIAQRRASDMSDSWNKDNLQFLETLRGELDSADKGRFETAKLMLYYLASGEQEARLAGATGGTGANKEGMMRSRMTDGLPFRGGDTLLSMLFPGIERDRMTISVMERQRGMVGTMFHNAGRFARLMHEKLEPRGSWTTDPIIMRMRENAVRRARELAALSTGEDGMKLLAEAQAVMDTFERYIPASYGFALEPYRVWMEVYASLHQSGSPLKAVELIKSPTWKRLMFASFMKSLRDVASGNMRADEVEFWFKDSELVRNMREIYNNLWQLSYDEEMARTMGETEKARHRMAEAYAWMKVQERFMAEGYDTAFLKKLGEVKMSKLVSKFLDRVAHQMDAYRKDVVLGRIRREVDRLRPLPDKDGKPVKGRMGADDYRRVCDYEALLNMTKGEKMAFERERYTGEDGERRWADIADDELINVQTYDDMGEEKIITCQKREYEMFACYDGMTAAQAEAAGRALSEFIETGRHAWENAQEAQRARIAELSAPLLIKVGELKGSTAAENRAHEQEVLNKRYLMKKRKHKILNYGGWLLNDAQTFDAVRDVEEMKEVCDHFQNKIAYAHSYLETSEARRGRFTRALFSRVLGTRDQDKWKAFVDAANEVQDAGVVLKEQEPDFIADAKADARRMIMGLMRRKTHTKNFNEDVFAKGLQELLAKNTMPADIAMELRDKYGDIGDAGKAKTKQALAMLLTPGEAERFLSLNNTIDARAKKARDKWLEEREKAKEEQRKFDEEHGIERAEGDENLRISRAEAAYRVLLCEQEDYAESLGRKGYTPEVVDRLREFAGKELMDIAYALRRKLGERTDAIAEMYEETYGMPFPRVENYFRAYFDAGWEAKEHKVLGDEGSGAAAGKGTAKILYTRHHNDAPIDRTMNVFQAFESAMKEQDVFLAFGSMPREMAQLLNARLGKGRTTFGDAYAYEFGQQALSDLRAVVDNMTRVVADSERSERSMMRLVNSWSGSLAQNILSWRFGSYIKQYTGVFNTLAGSDRVSYAEWMTSFARVNAGRGRLSLEEMRKRPELRDRFKGWNVSAWKQALDEGTGSVSVKGKGAEFSQEGMDMMERLDVNANVRSACILYDALYRKLEAENPKLDKEMVDAECMQEVRMALALKSQPLDFRQRALTGTKRGLFKMGSMFLGGESINTFGNCLRLASRGEWGRFAQVWLTHGVALQGLTFLYNLLTDDEEMRKKRSFGSYAFNAVFGPLMGVPIVGDLFSNTVNNTLRRVPGMSWVPRCYSSSLMPMGELDRATAEVRRVVKKGRKASPEDWILAADTTFRALASVAAAYWAAPASAGGAKMKGAALAVAAAGNLVDFGVRVERNVRERVKRGRWFDK